MTLRNLLRAIAVLSALFGIGFVLAPGTAFAPYGVHLDGSGMFAIRLFGAANVGFAVALWLAAASEPPAQRGLAWGVIAYSAVEAVVAGAAAITGTTNVLGWGFVVLDAIFVGAALALMRPAAAPTTGQTGGLAVNERL